MLLKCFLEQVFTLYPKIFYSKIVCLENSKKKTKFQPEPLATELLLKKVCISFVNANKLHTVTYAICGGTQRSQ